MRVVLLGALLALPALAQVPSHSQPPSGGPSPEEKSPRCNEKPRSVLLETGLHIDLVYCGTTPDVTTTVGTQEANNDGKFYTIIMHNIHRDKEDSPAYVLIYKPNADWAVPPQSLDSMGAIILKTGNIEEADHSGWVAEKDFKFNHQGQDWLQARQIVMHKPTAKQWVYYRIIRDTRHNLLYVLYQRDDEGGVNKENSFFDSFTVDPSSFTVDPGNGPGAHLPPPYPNP